MSTLDRIGGTVDDLRAVRDAVLAARRLLRLDGKAYDHSYCNEHEYEGDAEENCVGCRDEMSDRLLVSKVSE